MSPSWNRLMLTWSPWSSTRSITRPTLVCHWDPQKAGGRWHHSMFKYKIKWVSNIVLTLRPVFGRVVLWLDHCALVIVKAEMNFFEQLGVGGAGQYPKRFLNPVMQSNIYCYQCQGIITWTCLCCFLSTIQLSDVGKNFLLYLQRYLAHIELHKLVIPLKCMEKTHYYILMLRRKFLSGLRPCERRNQVFSGSLTRRYDWFGIFLKILMTSLFLASYSTSLWETSILWGSNWYTLNIFYLAIAKLIVTF